MGRKYLAGDRTRTVVTPSAVPNSSASRIPEYCPSDRWSRSRPTSSTSAGRVLPTRVATLLLGSKCASRLGAR